MKNFELELKEKIRGEVRVDPIARRVYSVDASIYEVEPLAVVLPLDNEDLRVAIQIANEHQLSVTPRGAATGITGGCLGEGVILDTSKYLNQILEINYEQEYVRCQPGVVQDVLNEALAEKNYRLGPDTSTGNRATIGGMVGNNAAGARSLRYGKMVDHVEEVKLLLASGEQLTFAACTESQWRQKCLQNNAEGRIYQTVEKIRQEYRQEIEQHFPQIPRRVSGYNLDELLKPFPLNISKLIVGSEGSLGIVTEIKVRISPRPKTTGLCVIHFKNILEGMRTVEELLLYHPLSLEMIDQHIIRMGRLSPTIQNKLDWLKGDPEAVFVFELEGESSQEVSKKLCDLQAALEQKKIGYAYTLLTDKKAMNDLWDVRKAGLELLLSKRSYSRAIAFIEDLTVSPKVLANFMEEFLLYLKSVGKQAGIYGHVGAGCMHIRPYIDLRKPDELKLMQKMIEDITTLLLKHHGALSGEHGDGRVRSWLNEKLFGKKIYEAFLLLKSAFDSDNRMNPGKVVQGQEFLKNLRMHPEIKQPAIETFLDFSAEGGLALAVDLCNGNGLCRKREGTMCPSFQATGDEYDSTRARAQSLRAVMNGLMKPAELTDEGILDVLDLCLECKGCKKECPSHVDMAKMKAEFLFHYQEKKGYSLRNRLFGQIGWLYQKSSPFAAFFNTMGTTKFTKFLLKQLGITTERPLPQLAKETFSRWWEKQPPQPGSNTAKKVVLFNDTYNEFTNPEIGQAAIKLLHASGYDVIIPQWHCCGRTLLSKGLLREAKKKAEAIMDLLLPFAMQGIPIVGLEPSCILTIKDDYTGLLGAKNRQAAFVAAACWTIDEFLHRSMREGNWLKLHSPTRKKVLVHGHCHQKALVGTRPTIELLKSVQGFEVEEIASGCCGLAGSFGYEAEHYELSMKIGELHLFPSIRNCADKEKMVVSNGVSCRAQIGQGTKQPAKHVVEVLAEVLGFAIHSDS